MVGKVRTFKFAEIVLEDSFFFEKFLLIHYDNLRS